MAINKGKVEAELFQAQAHLYKHTFNFIGSMCLKSALQLNIPDIIHSHGRPITLPELLSALHMDPAKSFYVYRLMRLLIHSGFFSTTKVPKDGGEEEGYDLTPSSRLLLKANVPSLSPFVQAMFHPAIVHSSEHLGDWFSSDDPTPCHTAHGMGFWDYLSQNQEFNRLFNEAMISDSSMMNLVIKDCKSVFEGFNSLVDVGGGKGAVSRIISDSLPNLQCTVLDLPHVVENLDLILVPCGLLIMFAYHLILLYRYLHRPHTTTKGFEDYDKRAWVERIMQAEKRDIPTALSVIQSNITAATFMASVSLTICSLIGAWISNGSNKLFQSDLIYGDINPTTISIKYICLLICFLLAFSFFVQSIRHFVHATYLISTPDSSIPVSSVEIAVIRGDHFWLIGLRAIYFALDLLLWFFGPIPMFVSSVVMVIALHSVDSNSRPLHNTCARGSQQFQKARMEGGYAPIKN